MNLCTYTTQDIQDLEGARACLDYVADNLFLQVALVLNPEVATDEHR